jgi:multidrug resistance efflux pump
MSGNLSNGVSVEYDTAKRKQPRWRWYLLLAIVFALPVFFLSRMLFATLVQTSPATVMLEQVVLHAPVPGQVASIVTEGARVQGGDVMFTLAQHGIATLAEGEIDVQQNILSLTQERLQVLQQQFNRLQALQRQGAATQQEVETARLQWLSAQEQAGAAQRELLASNIRQPGVTTVEVLSPLPATVSRRFVQANEWVQAGDELMVLQTQNSPWIQAFLSPENVKFGTPGQEATLVFMDGHRVPAVVERVLPEAQRPPSDRSESMYAQSAAIVVRLKPLRPLARELQVQRLPLDVQFKPRWPWDSAPPASKE